MASERGTGDSGVGTGGLHREPRRIALESRVPRIVLLGGLPGVIVSLFWLWTADIGIEVRWTLTVVVVVTWLAAALIARERVIRPLQTLSNLLSGLREGDYSVRGAGASDQDALGVAVTEINALGNTLQAQRLGAMEATALLRTVIAEIDAAIFAFDAGNQLRLANRAGERLLGMPVERLLGRTADALGLDMFLSGDSPRVHDLVFPGRSGRWEVRRTTFRQDGRPHTLVVMSDLSKTLREEELLAWQRLVRVLSHEINNSLTPIKSIAGSLLSLLDRSPRPADADDDLRGGLGIIGNRSEALSRFMSAYALLARLPAPKPGAVDVGIWARRAGSLETRVPIHVQPGPPLVIQADGDQLDQLLINLVRNAADASLETGGQVCVSWTRHNGHVDVDVVDEGPGLATTANLFVPFYTTKPSGTGIGLVLCRQIAEAHGGVLSLENRTDARGCIARIRLPVNFRDRLG
jgi:two-component system, NtrC family, nitrogen regulation sensor histidine kinase NtrY